MRTRRVLVLTQCIPDAVVHVVERLPQFPRLPVLPEHPDPVQSIAQPPADMFVEVPGQVLALEDSEYANQSSSVLLAECIRHRVG